MAFYLVIRQTFSVVGPALPASFHVEPYDDAVRVRLVMRIEAQTLADAFGVAVAAFTAALDGWTEEVDGVTVEDITAASVAAGAPQVYAGGMTGSEIAEQFERWLASG